MGILEYQMQCCGVRRPLRDITVKGYVDPDTGLSIACKYGFCKKCGEQRPKADFQIRIKRL